MKLYADVSGGSGSVELDQCVSESALRLRASASVLASAINPHIDRIATSKMVLDIDGPQEQFQLLANACHARYLACKEQRMVSLRKIYSRLAEPDDLIVMLYCRQFFPMFENWLASCDAHNIPVRQRLVTFTLDAEARDRTKALGIETYLLDPALYMQAGASEAYGDREFGRTMFYKNAIVRDVLELGANVLFQDVDLIWLRDPFPYFEAHCSDNDVSIMFDGANPVHAPLYANTGFFYVACSESSKALFETALRNIASVFQCRSHQRPFNQILAFFALHNVLTVRVLPELVFLNGHLFNLENGVRERANGWRDSGYVVHYSWTANRAEKQRKIDQFGLNYL